MNAAVSVLFGLDEEEDEIEVRPVGVDEDGEIEV